MSLYYLQRNVPYFYYLSLILLFVKMHAEIFRGKMKKCLEFALKHSNQNKNFFFNAGEINMAKH